MQWPELNYLAVLVCGVLIFALGGLWYSPVLFAKRWMALIGKSPEELAGAAQPLNYLIVFTCGLFSAVMLGVVVNRFGAVSLAEGAGIGVLCWLGFAAPTSFATALFSATPRGLWVINSSYNLVSFLLAGAILAVWR